MAKKCVANVTLNRVNHVSLLQEQYLYYDTFYERKGVINEYM